MAGCQYFVFAAPKVVASCKLVNLPEEIVHKGEDGRGYLEDIDDWFVHCTLTRGDKTVWTGDLELQHPASFETASAAAKDFVKVKAPEIVSGKFKKEK
jgi:hypothetical protein